MNVFVVITEWNRPHDCEGGYTLEGIAATREKAEWIKLGSVAEYTEFGHKQFNDPNVPDSDDSEWDYDIEIREEEVQ